jgi:hypothetical protein
MGTSTIGLTNSRRRFEKATYTPVKTRERNDGEAGDVLARAALVRSLQATPSELAALRESAGSESERSALTAVSQLMDSHVADAAMRASAALAAVPDRELISFAGKLESVRAARIGRLSAGVKELSERHREVERSRSEKPAPYRDVSATRDSRPLQAAAAQPNTEPANALPANRDDLTPLLPRAASPTLNRDARTLPVATFLLRPSSSTLQLATAHPFTTEMFGTLGAARLPSVLVWAAEEATDRLDAMIAEVRQYLPAATAASVVDLVGGLAELDRRRRMSNVFVQALNRRPLEPVGLLHLERLEMTPVAIEPGELLYSLPLAPKEKVTLAHKEWTTREEEFSRYIQDFFENFSETGVAESDDLAMSSLTQARHANALSLNQSPVGTSGVTITNAADAAGATSTVENLASIEESKMHSRVVTSRATARSVKDHKVSFTVTTVTGAEDFTARVLENPRDDEAMRIDYYRRMRRWRTDLYRYGVRMTYDVVLPDPGRRLRRRQTLIQDIDQQLAAGNPFTLKPSEITVWNWSQLADQYGAALEPPREQRRFEVVHNVDYGPAEEIDIHGQQHTRQKIEELQVDVPGDYQLGSLSASVQVSTWHVTFQQRWLTVIGDGIVRGFSADGSGYINASVSFDPLRLPENGPVKVTFQSQYVSNGVLKLSGTIDPRPAVVEEWRIRCWLRLRDAAAATSSRQRDELRARRAVLEREIAQTDSLTLRRMEREQIMLSVLEWLFPEFDESIGWVYSIALPGSWATGVWQDIMEYGEYIKFVHEAIDWDNVMVFLFPYFWDTPGNHEGKLFLDHKDPLHREFMRAGAARVVLAIRPGFEEEVASLLDQGQLGALPDGHRFKKVAEDVRAANAEYARQAVPEDEAEDNDRDRRGRDRDDDDDDDNDERVAENPRIPGVRIGSWTDYTPTGALDIEVLIKPVQT